MYQMSRRKDHSTHGEQPSASPKSISSRHQLPNSTECPIASVEIITKCRPATQGRVPGASQSRDRTTLVRFLSTKELVDVI